ncbi:hypothetical protein [Ferruginibacter sp.]|nr:hypothetical protein [Ferruginibacter sp.]
MLLGIRPYTIIIILFFLSSGSFAQNTGEQLFRNPLFPGNLKKDPVSVLRFNNTSIEELINYFADKRKTPSYKYYSEKDGKTWVVSILEPVKYFREEIEKSLKEPPNGTPRYSEFSDKINKLFYRVNTLHKIDDGVTKTIESELLAKEIEALSPSKEKVSLLLRYTELRITSRNYYDEIETTHDKAQKIIELLPNKYDKAIALVYLANFLLQFQANIAAISTYYEARENVYNCNKPDTVKNQLQGYICEQIASVFYSETIPRTILKSVEYYQLAMRYYKLAERKDDAERVGLNLVGYLLYRNEEMKGLISDSVLYSKSIKQELLGLQMFLDEYDNRPSENKAINYYMAYGIGIACKNHGKLTASIHYFMEALHYAIEQKNYIFVRSSVANISLMYGTLLQWEEADKYIGLLSLFEGTWENVSIFNKAMQKAAAYSNAGRLDSALLTINKVQFDTVLMNSFIPPFIRKRYQEINNLKFSILYRLKNDSAHIYENYCHYDQEFYQNQFAQLLERESKAISDWLERQGEKELSLKQELIASKELANSTLIKLNAIEKKERKTDSLRYSDSIRGINKIRTLENENNKVRTDKLAAEAEALKAKNRLWGVAIISIVCISLILYYFIRKFNKAKTEKLRLQKSHSDLKLLSSLAVNHDIDKFIPLLPSYLRNVNDIEKVKLQHVVEKFRIYHKLTFKKSNSLTNKVADEIQAAKLSAEIYKYMKNSETVLNIDTDFPGAEIQEIQIPKNMITSFISNSVKHGSSGKDKLNILVKALYINEGYQFYIEDDGIGFNSLGEITSDRGIGLICRQVESFNEGEGQYKIIFELENIKNKNTQQGVIVGFKIVKK